jgi:methyl-accepting chemotaxis protein
LTSIQSAKTSQISEYFALIEAQVRSLAKNPTTIAATAEVKRGFFELSRRPDERASTPQSVARSADLSAYYSDNFLPALNDGFGTSFGIESVFAVAETARYLQYHYISNNHFPLGEKYQLEHADDQSLYSRVHTQVIMFLKSTKMNSVITIFFLSITVSVTLFIRCSKRSILPPTYAVARFEKVI